MTSLSIAIKNLRGNLPRSIALFLVMFVLSGTLLCISLLYTALTHSIELSRMRLGADIMVVPSGRSSQAEELFLVGSAGSFTMNGAAAFRTSVLRSYKGVAEATPQLFVVSAPLPCCSLSNTMIVGFDPETDFVITPWLQEQATAKRRFTPDEALVGADILAGVGGRLKLFGREFVIAGKLDRTDMPYLDSGIFIPMEGVRRMVVESKQKALRTLTVGPDEISCLLIRLREDANADRTALQLEHDYPGRTALVVSEMVRRSARGLSIPLKGIALLFLLQWAASMVLIGVVHSFSVDQRRGEIGILKALGATEGNVRAMLLLETSALSGAASLSGIAGGLLLVRAFSGYLLQTIAIPLHVPEGAMLAALIAAVFIASLLSGVLPSLLSAQRASRIEPFYLIRGDREGNGGRSSS